MNSIQRAELICWQEKKVRQFIRGSYKGEKTKLTKMLELYTALTEIYSDYPREDIRDYTRQIQKYSGLSEEFIPSALEEFQKLGIINIKLTRNQKGQFVNKVLQLRSDNVPSPIPGSAGNGSIISAYIEYIYINILNTINNILYLSENKNNNKSLSPPNPPQLAKPTKIRSEEINQFLEDYRQLLESLGLRFGQWACRGKGRYGANLFLQDAKKRSVTTEVLLLEIEKELKKNIWLLERSNNIILVYNQFKSRVSLDIQTNGNNKSNNGKSAFGQVSTDFSGGIDKRFYNGTV